MPVAAIKEYIGVPRDTVANFNGKQLVYVSWDHHLLFASPFLLCLPPQTTFGELVNGPLAALTKPDPDAASVDWKKVEWLKSNQPWTPDFERSLADNGIGHKDQIRFRTPGLQSLSAA
ncbi:phenol hydroxylase subunit P4 [Propionivibrio sp.]|uniref:phenol hydroxylase subunit P4 n=1 Tax=Propionivibrio sp. TaxID=2212460 RepID=UPI003BF27F5D